MTQSLPHTLDQPRQFVFVDFIAAHDQLHHRISKQIFESWLAMPIRTAAYLITNNRIATRDIHHGLVLPIPTRTLPAAHVDAC